MQPGLDLHSLFRKGASITLPCVGGHVMLTEALSLLISIPTLTPSLSSWLNQARSSPWPMHRSLERTLYEVRILSLLGTGLIYGSATEFSLTPGMRCLAVNTCGINEETEEKLNSFFKAIFV